MIEMLSEFRRYGDALGAQIGSPAVFTAEAESATAVQVERGAVLPRVLTDPANTAHPEIERLLELAGSQRLPTVAVVDRAGHHRAVYRPLLVYCCLQAFQTVYETLPRSEFGRWEEGLRPWCDLLESELGAIDWGGNAMPAALGGSAAESVWMALALHVAGKVYVRDAWTDLASHTFGGLLRAQQPGGAFLEAGAGDGVEVRLYHEMAILHAAGSYAVQAEDRTVAAAVARSSEFHLAQNQPDHSSAQPWGLFPLIWNARTRPLADQILHAMRMNSPNGGDGVSLMLLSDALYCLNLFLR